MNQARTVRKRSRWFLTASSFVYLYSFIIPAARQVAAFKGGFHHRHTSLYGGIDEGASKQISQMHLSATDVLKRWLDIISEAEAPPKVNGERFKSSNALPVMHRQTIGSRS